MQAKERLRPDHVCARDGPGAVGSSTSAAAPQASSPRSTSIPDPWPPDPSSAATRRRSAPSSIPSRGPSRRRWPSTSSSTNGSSHVSKETKAWFAAHPRWVVHYTPPHASWVNQIELFFSILQRKVIRNGNFDSREDLVSKLLGFHQRLRPHGQAVRLDLREPGRCGDRRRGRGLPIPPPSTCDRPVMMPRTDRLSVLRWPPWPERSRLPAAPLPASSCRTR